jgi:hypothetical protein
MMESTNTTERVEVVCILGPVETYTRESTLKMRDMEMDRCSGPMGACMKESG